MSLSSRDISGKRFRLALRGYDVDEVDAFLDAVAAELGQLRAAPSAPAVTAPADVSPVDGDDCADALRTLRLAEQVARRLVAEAGAAAEETRARAEEEAAALLDRTRTEVERLTAVEGSLRTRLQQILDEHQRALQRRAPILDTPPHSIQNSPSLAAPGRPSATAEAAGRNGGTR